MFCPNRTFLIQGLPCPPDTSDVISDMRSNACTYSNISIYTRITGSANHWTFQMIDFGHKCYGNFKGISNSFLQNYLNHNFPFYLRINLSLSLSLVTTQIIVFMV